MGKNLKAFGILVPLVTPCDRKGRIDKDGLRSVCSDMVQAGCEGIFIMGSTGRGPWYSRDQQAEACRTAADFLRADTPLFAGCMATGLDGMIENARAMADSGARVAVVTAPGYFHYNQAEVHYVFMKFADNSPLPVLIYDIPGFAGIKLQGEVVESLSRHGNIAGLKDSSADMDQFRQLIGALESLPNFYLFQGKEHLLADSIIEGASGFVVSLLHIDPRPFVLLYDAARTGQDPKAQKIQTGITKLLGLIEDCFQRRPETSTLFHILNASLVKRGICPNILLEHEGECPAWIDDTVEEAMELCSSIADEATR